jgi:hypothetical protein
MMWLGLYLCVGGVVLACMLLMNWRDGRGRQSRELLASLRKPLSRREVFLQKFVAPVLTCVAAVLGWPWALWFAWKSRREGIQRDQRKADAVFRVRPQDLGRQTQVAEVEVLARVHDPLSAVPDVPFGHLNAAWQAFVAERPPNAELWSFACDWTSDWGVTFARQGYVWVQGDECSPWMLTRDVLRQEEGEG